MLNYSINLVRYIYIYDNSYFGETCQATTNQKVLSPERIGCIVLAYGKESSL